MVEIAIKSYMISYNRRMPARIFAWIGIIIFLYYVSYSIFAGIINPVPQKGDSWDYHIPISKMILTGEIISPKNPVITQWYYPGSSEAINSLLILLHVPLTLSNVLAIIGLFFLCWRLAGVFKLNYYESLFFATTIVTLNGLVRWFNSVTIDIWLVNFFLLSLILLERPNKRLSYFFVLGLSLGMIIGTKFTGVYYVMILVLFYGKKLTPFISFKNLCIFVVPFSVLGLSWYVRNYILFGNPLYPLYFLGLPYTINFDMQVWNMFPRYPKDIIDAFFGEYKIWLLAVPFVIIQLARKIFISQRRFLNTLYDFRLEIICLLLFIVFILSPTDAKRWIMVSSIRYSYASFVLAILTVFLYCKKVKKMEWVFVASIVSMIMVTSFSYYPKLIFIYGSIAGLSFYALEKYKKKLQKLFS